MTSLFTEWYMGNYIRPLSDAVFTIASDDLWIESLAIQQLHTTANLPNMQRVVGMPDLHPGRGYPIGAAFFSVGRFYPALVGNDIGCGMALWQTDILARKYNADKFEKRLSDLDDVAEESWLEENLPSAFAQHPWRSSLGSIGGGNHFAELQQVKATGSPVLDVAHNFVSACQIGDQQGWLHRKGATPDDNGLVIIPGSRGDYSWIVQPVANEKTLHSLAHGAGRKWGRTECKGRLAAKYTVTQLSRTELGSRVICRDKQLIFEEAPQAYKSAESVVQCLVQAGLIIPVARLRPVLTLKNSGGKKG
ncbi:TPA: RtcB family protein [Escherichia coli]|nr:RtcB family protein [Escherichia coli]HBA3989056.1 RtcB family protein [Escherichia coli]